MTKGLNLRRRSTAAAAIAALALAAASGCGSDDDGGNGGGATTGGGASTDGGSLAPEITAVDFGGSYQEATIEALGAPFEEAEGVKVNFTTPPDVAKIRAQVSSDNVTWDAVTADTFFVAENCGTLFEELDTQPLIDAGIGEQFLASDCGYPAAVYSFVLVYDKGAAGSNTPTGWDAYFDTDTYPGKRGMPNTPLNGSLEAALLADGVAPEDLYPLDVDRAFKKLDTIKDDIAWVQSYGQLTDQLVNEQVAMSLIFNGRAKDAEEAGANIDLVYDQQLNNYDTWAIVKGSPKAKTAEAWFDFSADPERQAQMTELTGYGNGNLKSKPKVNALTEKYLPSNPKAAATQVQIDQQWWAENYDDVARRFTEWQAG